MGPLNDMRLFEDYVYTHTFSFVDRELTPKELEQAFTLIALAGEVGELLNAFKKCIRDNKPQDKTAYLHELGDSLHYIVRLLQNEGYTLADIARMNINKLDKRMQQDESFASKVAHAMKMKYGG